MSPKLEEKPVGGETESGLGKGTLPRDPVGIQKQFIRSSLYLPLQIRVLKK
jgi:hypothetical protein